MSTSVKTRNNLIKRYHVICGALGIDRDGRTDMLVSNYGVESSADLQYGQLRELVGELEAKLPKNCLRDEKLNLWRKRLMASVGGWLALAGGAQTAENIKAIACRASERTNFNHIPLEQLRNLYYLFLKKQQDFHTVDLQTADEILKRVIFN